MRHDIEALLRAAELMDKANVIGEGRYAYTSEGLYRYTSGFWVKVEDGDDSRS